MPLGRYVAAAAVLSIVALNERVADFFWPIRSDFCEKSCGKPQCFLTKKLDPIVVRDCVSIYVQVTQSIVEEEVQGSGYRACLVRRLGRNIVPGYPFPDAGEIERSEEFKTTNSIFLHGKIADGRVTLDPASPPPDRARVGLTDLHLISIGGKTFVNDKLVEMPRLFEKCLLGGIAKLAAMPNLGRRIVIGSRISLDVHFTGPNTAVITPRVAFSRFPTTFIWIGSDRKHLRAEPLAPVLEHCEGWR